MVVNCKLSNDCDVIVGVASALGQCGSLAVNAECRQYSDPVLSL